MGREYGESPKVLTPCPHSVKRNLGYKGELAPLSHMDRILSANHSNGASKIHVKSQVGVHGTYRLQPQARATPSNPNPESGFTFDTW